jgi:hypothetical protein
MELLTISNISILILILINIILLRGIRNLLKQNEQLEDRLLSTISSIRYKVETALNNMRQLDNREVFEKDDEVGATFTELKNIVEELNNEI